MYINMLLLYYYFNFHIAILLFLRLLKAELLSTSKLDFFTHSKETTIWMGGFFKER